jgi:hypothetical protein
VPTVGLCITVCLLLKRSTIDMGRNHILHSHQAASKAGQDTCPIAPSQRTCSAAKDGDIKASGVDESLLARE